MCADRSSGRLIARDGSRGDRPRLTPSALGLSYRRMRSRLPLGAALLAALTLSTLTPRTRADLPPPPGFVESCTLAKQSRAGRECLGCSAYHGNSNHCSMSLAEYGFTESCRSRGASAWSEVWCRAASPQAKPVPQDVLLQLGDATGHPPVSPGPTPTATLPSAPSSLTDPAPPAPANPAPAAPPIADAPVAPPALPPTGGCGGCAAPGPKTAVWAPLLALGALALGWSRRRARR
jgi:hypothetical protein